jgi:hypothetical protein
MANTVARERVALTSPTGLFTVFVSPGRAQALRARGYREAKSPPQATPKGTTPKRPELNARARALGIPAVGTNAALAAAIAAAEA